MDSENVEQRRESRESSLERILHVRVEDADNNVFGGSIRNLSQTGALIVGDTKGLAVEQEIRVVFVLPLNRQVAYRAIIRHIVPNQYFGVSFEDDDPESRRTAD